MQQTNAGSSRPRALFCSWPTTINSGQREREMELDIEFLRSSLVCPISAPQLYTVWVKISSIRFTCYCGLNKKPNESTSSPLLPNAPTIPQPSLRAVTVKQLSVWTPACTDRPEEVDS
jgi:hypothetical protein